MWESGFESLGIVLAWGLDLTGFAYCLDLPGAWIGLCAAVTRYHCSLYVLSMNYEIMSDRGGSKSVAREAAGRG